MSLRTVFAVHGRFSECLKKKIQLCQNKIVRCTLNVSLLHTVIHNLVHISLRYIELKTGFNR